MEARKRYYTFSQALEKIMGDPDNLVMTRTHYISEGPNGPSVIMELLPSVESDFPDSPVLMKVNSTGMWEYFPTQEDLHSMTWMVLRKEVSKDEPVPGDLTEDEVRDPLTESAAQELTKVLKQFNKLLGKLIYG